MIDLTDHVVIITGAARGQGQAEAELFAEHGANVLVADIDLEPAIGVATGIGARAKAVQLDVSSEESWQAALTVAIETFGPVDALVNNAAIFRPVSILDASLADIQAMVAINQMGTLLGIRCVGRHMVERGKGSIVNIASVGAISPGENSTLYGMTKGAIVTLSRGAAVELAPAVRVNCVLPGGVATRMLGDNSAPFFDNIPLGRVGDPIEIARAAAFFASSASSYCTGAALVVDGGWLLGETAEKFGRLTAASIAARGESPSG